MHRSRFRRVAPLALFLLVLALPVAAQPDGKPGANLGRLVSALWERLGASLLSVWEIGQAHTASDRLMAPAPTPPAENTSDDGDGRIHIDPDG